MTEYVCFYCGKKIKLESKRGVRCDSCGRKVMFKKRPQVTKTIKAR